MSNADRSGKKRITSSDSGNSARRPKNDPDALHGSTSHIDRLREECCAESVSSKPSIESEIDSTLEADLTAKHGNPSVRTPFKCRSRVAQSALAFLPYEAAQLAASAPSLQQSRFDGKLIPLSLAGIMMTTSVVTGAVIWSMHDDVVVAPTAEVSVASDDRMRRPDNSSASQLVGIQSHAALTSVQKNDSDDLKAQIKAGLPATLVAAASSGSMVSQTESAIAARPPTLTAKDREANGVVPGQLKLNSDTKTASLKNNSLARPQHQPSFKPLEVAALSPPAVVTTSFRPAFKPREINLLNSPRAGLDDAKYTPMLKRLWGKLVQGVAEAYRNRDTSYQLVMKADSRGGGSDEHRGGGNDYDNHDG